MVDGAFSLYRDEVITSLNEHGVAYKLVGGSVVQLIDSTRETSDLDLMIQKTRDNIDKLIQALAACQFASISDLSEQIYGDAGGVDDYDAFQLIPSNPLWSEFHIDMCFKLGDSDYNTYGNETHETSSGLQIRSIPFVDIVRMKAKVFPKPRLQDIKDIGVIADHLGLDPMTGEPKSDGKDGHK